jgi:hypothetical protein
MSRADREADRAYQALDQIEKLLTLRDYPGAARLARKTVRDRHDRELDYQAEHDDATAEEAGHRVTAPAPSKRERFRAELSTLASPARLLAPVNVLEVYLADHPMWGSWGWDDTHAVNMLMLPFVQGLDAGDPLPDDPRLALPFTVAACALSQALHLSPELSRVELTADVYHLVADGIVTLDRLSAPEGLTEDFAHVVDAARLLLLQAVRFGLETWGHGLILRCALEARCKLGEPFYVNAKRATAGHGKCRVAAHRALRLVKPDVTTKVRTRGK